ncbi:MAG: peptide chain release factor N(5)-glutamine methyltransferase [Porticoccaceae bacterium]|nr:peptide chain release factor N(5)-glutamine methyltransferase [Porticoccaceae bacterium]
MLSTVAEILRCSEQLASVSDTPRLDVEVLLCHLLGRDRSFLYTWPEHRLSEQQLMDFQAALTRRKAGEPIAYITGEREFWSLPLAVEPSTLIPRPDTELLVEIALELPLPEKAQVLDMGTGTGAIALALASEKPCWVVHAIDQSHQAVALAQRNCQRLGVRNAEIWQSCWYQGVGERRYQLIVSNPPYIDPGDPHLSRGDVRFEPHSALVAEDAGLADIETIASGASAHLEPGGWLLLEHGYNQGDAVRQCLEGAGFADVQTRRDLGGRDRATLGCLA